MTFEQAVNEVTEAIEHRTYFVLDCPCISCDLIREAMAILRARASESETTKIAEVAA